MINETKDYHRYLGGSPTNVAMNCSRLDLKAKLIACVGNDGFGSYIDKRLEEVGVDYSSVAHLKNYATSVIFVSRTDGTPDFIPYREADCQISEDQLSKEDLQNAKIYHTTCFALSKEPARTTILNKAKEAYEQGCKLSIDLNYADKIWGNKKDEAFEVIKTYCSYNPLIKVSEDDVLRLFGKHLTPSEIFEYFHKAGADIVCLTLGSKGVKLSQKGEALIELPAIKLEKVVDATGAGDAFWSGFLYAYIKEKPIEECLTIALKLAALKLQNIGRLPNNINVISQLL
jgi:fructokinase